MRIQNNRTKTISAIVGITMLGIMSVPAFATLSTSNPPWNTVEEIPSYQGGQCTGSSNTCAYAPTYAQDQLISQTTTPTFGNTATVRNNQNFGSNSVGLGPQVTTSSSSIEGAVYTNFNGVENIPSGSGGYLQYGGNIWIYSNGWTQASNGGFAYQITQSSVTGNWVLHTTISNSGSNSYRIGAEQDAFVQTPYFQTTQVDFWNNSGHADVTQLNLCDTSSQPCP